MWTAFGPTNVAIHRMTTAMELGDVQVAVDLGPRVDASGLPVERQVRHAIETARAYSARNRRDDALGVLLDAEQLAPEQIKHHAISRQLVLSWLRNHCGPRSVPLDRARPSAPPRLTVGRTLGAVTDPSSTFATPRVAAGALFLDSGGRVLLVHPTYKDIWDIPGGYVERGESPAAACRREVAEELGLDRLPPDSLPGSSPWTGRPTIVKATSSCSSSTAATWAPTRSASDSTGTSWTAGSGSNSTTWTAMSSPALPAASVQPSATAAALATSNTASCLSVRARCRRHLALPVSACQNIRTGSAVRLPRLGLP